MESPNTNSNARVEHTKEPKTFSAESVVPPIYETSVFAFSDTQKLIDVISEKTPGYVYTRFDNPTVRQAEKKLAGLDGAEDAILFSSGMAAISTAILSLVSSGDHLVSTRDIYGGTLSFFTNVLPRFGIKVSLVEATKIDEIAAAIQPSTKLLYVETPTNPLLKVVDLVQVAKLGLEQDIPVMVDSTFATPYNLRPIQLGAKVVLHSATKYLGGHHDLTAGVVCGSNEFIQEVRTLRKSLGGTLDPLVAWLLLRSLQTLELRMGKHNANGMEVAKFLAGHPRVKQVYYPGLTNHLQHSLAKQQMRGFGGVVSFEIDDNFETITTFVESLELFRLAPSLGGTESLVTQPVTSSHYSVSIEERTKAGITDQLVRLAVGVENSKEIVADLEQAFDKMKIS